MRVRGRGQLCERSQRIGEAFSWVQAERVVARGWGGKGTIQSWGVRLTA
jgi:hypothetical protein